MKEQLADILERCLKATQKGASLESCLETYPDHRKELEPLLKAALSFRKVSPISLTAEAKKALWQRVAGPAALNESLKEVDRGLSIKDSVAKHPELKKELKPLLETTSFLKEASPITLTYQNKTQMWQRISTKLQKVPVPAPTILQKAQRWAAGLNYQQLAPAFAAVLTLAVVGALTFSLLTPSGLVSRTPVDGKISLAKLSPQEVASYLKAAGLEEEGQAQARGAVLREEEREEEEEEVLPPEEPEAGAPPAPADLVVYAGNLENNLSWQTGVSAAAQSSSGVAGYNIYRADTEDGTYVKINSSLVTGTSYDDPVAQSELGIYWYKISAVGEDGKESQLTSAEPNLYVKIVHTFPANSNDQVIAANGKINFLVYAGALSQSTKITILEKQDAPDFDGGVMPVGPPFEFLPSGLTFSGPGAQVTMPYIFSVPDAEVTNILETAIRLFYYDELNGVYEEVPTTVNQLAKMFTAEISHFTTYWPGAVTNPHGTSTATTDYCKICHGIHNATGDGLSKWENTEVCYQCHGNVNSTQGPAGANGPNIQAEFLDCDDQSGGAPGSWTQTTVSDFNQDSHSNTTVTNTAGGEVTLRYGTGGTETLWSDGFESGSFGNWTSFDTGWAVDNDSVRTGLYSAHFQGNYTGSITKNYNLSGKSGVRFKYSRRVASLDSGEYLYVEYYNGTSWIILETLGNGIDSDWAERDIDLSGYTMSTNSRIRFRCNTSSDFDDAYVDNVEITASAPPGYPSSGSVTSTEIAPGAASWNQLSWTEAETVAAVKFKVDVKGWNGSSWDNLFTDLDTSPKDLSTVSASTYTKLQLVGKFTTTNSSNTPILYDWTVQYTTGGINPNQSSTHELSTSAAIRMQCNACHSPHRKIGDHTDLLRVKTATGTATGYTYSTTSTPMGNNFCWACHGTSANSYVLYKGQVSTTAYYSATLGDHRMGYEGVTAHDTSLPASGSAPNAWVPPADPRGGAQSTNIRCLNCHYHHGTSKALGLTGYRLTTAYSAGVEENLCYNCHKAAWKTGMKDIQAQFNKTYRHTVASTTYVHKYSEDTGTAFGGANRHVECADCHNSHKARIGISPSTASTASPPLYGTWGATPTAWNPAATPLPAAQTSWNRVTITSGVNEAYLCFKCHTYYAFGNSPPTGPSGQQETDVSREFNPNNLSYHPVLNQNTSETGGTYVSPWTSTSKMRCSSCHTNNTTGTTDPKGPHGSANKWILKANYNPDGTTTSDFALCFLCHNQDTYAGTATSGTNFMRDTKQLHTDTIHRLGQNHGGHVMNCTSCHSRVPHGINRRHLIGYWDDPKPYSNQLTGASGRPQVTRYTHATAGNYQQTSCYIRKDYDSSKGCYGGHDTP